MSHPQNLAGIETAKQYNQGPLAGALFENYVVAELLKKSLHEQTRESFYYLRTSNGVEIDLIIEKAGQRTWVEIKKTSTFSKRLIKNLEKWHGEDKAILCYQGEYLPAFNGIDIFPYQHLLLEA